jgi:hypothetical protein
MDSVGLQTIGGGEEPAGKARFYFVEPIAQNRLCDLHELQIHK